MLERRKGLRHRQPDGAVLEHDQPAIPACTRRDGRLIVLQDGAVALAAPQPMPPMEHRLAMMDAAGVAVQVLSVSAPNVFRLPGDVRSRSRADLNDEFSEWPGSSGRLKVFASLPLPGVDAALAELDRALALPHVVGIALCTTIDGVPLDDARFDPVWEELSRRGTVVFCHPTVAACTDGLREYALGLRWTSWPRPPTPSAASSTAGRSSARGHAVDLTHLGGTTPFLVPRFDNYFKQFPDCRELIDRPPSEIMRALWFDT